jgi:hypothetical protein
MANTYAATVLLEARQWLNDNYNKKFEERKTLTQILPVFIDGQKAIPKLDQIRKANTQATKVEYLTRKAFTMGSSKSCSPSGETGASGIAELTWSTKNFVIKHQKKKYDGNDLDAARGLAYDLFEAEKSFWFGATGIDAALLAYLEANRTQVNVNSDGAGHNTWDGTPNFFMDVANADRNRFYNWLDAEMARNNYEAPYFDIHDTMWMSDVDFYASQGTANSTNTAFQFDGFKRQKSNLIVPSGYYNSTHYIIPEGGVAMLDWNDPQNVRGEISGDRQWTTYQSKFFPEFTFDLFILNSCADTTADGGYTQDSVVNMEFTLNYSITGQPFSVANESAIYKYQVRTA